MRQRIRSNGLQAALGAGLAALLAAPGRGRRRADRPEGRPPDRRRRAGREAERPVRRHRLRRAPGPARSGRRSRRPRRAGRSPPSPAPPRASCPSTTASTGSASSSPGRSTSWSTPTARRSSRSRPPRASARASSSIGDGYAVTNAHVIEGETRIAAILYQKTSSGWRRRKIEDVQIVAVNPFLDLALLKLPPQEDLKYEPVVLGTLRRPRRRRRRLRRRQPAGARAERLAGHPEHPEPELRGAGLPPDRRGDQPGQLGRAAVQPPGRGHRRDQHEGLGRATTSASPSRSTTSRTSSGTGTPSPTTRTTRTAATATWTPRDVGDRAPPPGAPTAEAGGRPGPDPGAPDLGAQVAALAQN